MCAWFHLLLQFHHSHWFGSSDISYHQLVTTLHIQICVTELLIYKTAIVVSFSLRLCLVAFSTASKVSDKTTECFHKSIYDVIGSYWHVECLNLPINDSVILRAFIGLKISCMHCKGDSLNSQPPSSIPQCCEDEHSGIAV